ncbi:MAG: UvrD-helicase domain-containing protein [Chloroflexi bacterium]|nr:UvrD-helicase domain-containing protein [Chloroflexota bacterium]
MTPHSIEPHIRDREARETIREALDETLFVQAGAGTGKTSALVDRVVSLVLSGRSIERIVAITFTDRAAAELRERVRTGLESQLLETPDKESVIQTAISSLDRAQISTIHSFCQALLHRHAAEARIDPSFDVQDEVLAERRFQERWRFFLEAEAADLDSTKAIDRALALGLATWEIEALASELSSRQELAPRLERDLPEAPEPRWPDVSAMRRSLEELGLDRAEPDDRLRLKAEALLALVESIDRQLDDREAALAAGAVTLETRWKVSSAAAWGGGAVRNAVIHGCSAICEELKQTLRDARASALADVIPMIVRFVAEDARERGRRGTLTFDDLIVRVRDLLRDDAQAVRSLRSRYEAMLIDEFQDTDPLQVEIALSFATDPDSGKIEPGRLFVVGDPKQSIYRFRRADMAVYSQAREQFGREGSRFPQLALNRRSRPALLEWLNPVFGKMIGEGTNPEVQPAYANIEPFRTQELSGPGIAWLGDESPGNAREVREVEAQALTAQCLAVLKEGWEVVDRDGSVRSARLSDIAVLIPTRGILPALERTLLSAGVPYRVEGGSLVYRTQEVRDLTNCLTAIDDPADEVAIVAALRSPAFTCSDLDLARFRADGGRFNYLGGGLDDREGPVAEGLRILADYHQGRHDGSLASVVERFASERGIVEIGILDAGDRNSFRRVRFLVDQARRFEAAGPMSLRAFIRWLENRSEGRILDNEAAALDDDEDAVRITTIHGAKGLEFPIVFLAGLSWYPRDRASTYAVDRAKGEAAVCIGTKYRGSRFELGPVDRLNEQEGKHEEAEYARLLYVGATRARDHLVVSLYHRKSSRRSSGAERLIDAGARELAQKLTPSATSLTFDASPLDQLKVDPPASPSDFKEERAALVERSRRRTYTSATALIEHSREEDSEPWARGRGGTRLGRAVHAAIQSVPWDADEETIKAFARAEAVAEAVPDRADEVGTLVRRALRSRAAERARRATRALREVPFGLDIDGTTVEGFVDLLIEGPDGIEIVDWKTDRVNESEIDARLDQYRLQAGLYVLGIETATRLTVSNVNYVFVSPNVERSPGEPAELSRLAKERLEAGL